MAPVLYTSSIAAFIGVPQVMAYVTAKIAYFGMVFTLSGELAAKGVRFKAIAPGWIFSEMSCKALDNDPSRKAKFLSCIQMRCMANRKMSAGRRFTSAHRRRITSLASRCRWTAGP